MTPPGQGAGRDDIFREVVKLQGLIRAVLARSGVPEADVPDLAQDVLVIAHRSISKGAFCPPDPSRPLAHNVAAWLTGICRNVAKNHRSALAVEARVIASIEVEATVVSGPEEPYLAREQIQVIARLRLSAGQRKVVVMAGMGFTAEEIAGKLGVPLGTVSTWLRRARMAWRNRR